MSVRKIVVHSDVFLSHLTGSGHPSVLRQAMSKFFCYATVYQAIELFSIAKTDKEVKAIEDSMAAMKLMGLNPKNARRYGELLSSNKKVESWDILIAGLCLESRLPILTDRKSFGRVKGLVVIPTASIQNEKTGEEILRHAQR